MNTRMIDVNILAPSIAMRAGLRAIFEADARFAYIGEGSGVDELSGARFDVLVALPEALAREGLAALLVEQPEPFAVLLLSDDPADARLLQGLGLRAWGLLPPDAGEDELYAAATALHEGLLVGAPVLMRSLLAQMTGFSGAQEIVEELTPREGEVLELLTDGLANKQIAVALSISEHTVKFHISSIYGKLSAGNRTEAVRFGLKIGLISI